MTDAKGRDADTPAQMPAAGWLAALKRAWKEADADNLNLVAAGVAFYGFLTIVPILGALVMIYGLVADPQALVGHVGQLASVMPADAARLIGEQLMGVVESSGGKKGLGLLAALAIALYGASKGAGAIITALNIVYEEEEKRGFVKRTLLALAMVAGAMVFGLLVLLAIAATGYLQHLLPGSGWFVVWLLKAISWILAGAAISLGVAAVYRYAPSRDTARWSWLTPGALLATLGILVASLLFGLYVANFGNYNATWGSLGAVVVLLTWLNLSAYILLLGGELNAELEHQTARDTTEGRAAPLGQREAKMADEVAT